jgi:WD40 repeat protein
MSRTDSDATQDPDAARALVAQLTDLAYLEARLRADGGNTLPLEAEYARAIAALPPGVDREIVAAFGAALRLESHALNADPGSCYFQLYNRLWRNDGGPVDQALSSRPAAPGPWLRAVRPLPRPHPALVRTLAGHDGVVRAVGISADGSRAVSTGEDETVRVWDLARGTPPIVLHGPVGRINAAAMSADGRRVLSAGDDGLLRVWDSGEGMSDLPTWTLTVIHPGEGYRAVSSGSDGSLRAWRFRGSAPIPVSEQVGAVKVLARAGGEDVALVLENRTLHEQVSAGQQRPIYIGGDSQWTTAASMTPDGRWAIQGVLHDAVCVWDLASGAPRALLWNRANKWDQEHLIPDAFRQGHIGWVSAVTLTPEGRWAVSGGQDKTVRVWDLDQVALRPPIAMSRRRAKKQHLIELDAPGLRAHVLEGHSDWIRAVAVSADGSRILSGASDGTVRLWDLRKGVTSRVLQSDVGSVESVALTPDGRWAAVCERAGLLNVWNLESGAAPIVLSAQNTLRAVALTPDGRRAVSGADDGTVRVWDLAKAAASTAESTPMGHVRNVAVTPNGKMAVTSGPGHALQLHDLMNDTTTALLESDITPQAVAVTPDGRWVVCGGDDPTLRVWDLASGGPPTLLEGHTEPVYCVAISPDGRRIVSSGEDQTLRVWDIVDEFHDWWASATLESQQEWAVAVTPDGRFAVTAGSRSFRSAKPQPFPGDPNKQVRVWDLANVKLLRILEGHTGWVLAVDVTADGRLVVSGSEDGTVRVWDLASDTSPIVLAGHRGQVEAVAVAADGRWAMSCGADLTLRLWDLAANTEIARYSWDAQFHRCVFGPDGEVLAGDKLGRVLHLRLEGTDQVEG